MALEIVPLDLGRVSQVERSGQQYLTGAGEKIHAQMIVWLIRGGEALVVVDSGPGSPELVKKLHGRELIQDSGQTVEAALAGQSLQPDDIDIVLQTHLHWDHCLGLETNAFPKADIHIQRSEVQYASAPYPPHAAVFDPTVVSGLLSEPVGRYQNVKLHHGDYSLFPGLDVLHTPGHTPGLQVPIVAGASSSYAIASDNVPLQSNMVGPDPANWIPPGIHINLDDWYSSVTRLARAADVVLPSHDPTALATPVYR